MHSSLAEININEGATTKEINDYFYNFFSEFVKDSEMALWQMRGVLEKFKFYISQEIIYILLML